MDQLKKESDIMRYRELDYEPTIFIDISTLYAARCIMDNIILPTHASIKYEGRIISLLINGAPNGKSRKFVKVKINSRCIRMMVRNREEYHRVLFRTRKILKLPPTQPTYRILECTADYKIPRSLINKYIENNPGRVNYDGFFPVISMENSTLKIFQPRAIDPIMDELEVIHYALTDEYLYEDYQNLKKEEIIL